MAIWSIWVFDHKSDIYTIFGALVIIVAGLVIWFHEVRNSKLNRTLDER